MSWEEAEHWPGGQPTDAYRDAAEVVVAERNGLSFADRARLWWYSTDQERFGDTAVDVAMTSLHVYVRTQNGTQKRIRREHVGGFRVESGRRLFAVAKGADLVLARRGLDSVERLLIGHIHNARNWARPVSVRPTLAVMSVPLGLCAFLLWRCAQKLSHGFAATDLTGLSIPALVLFLVAVPIAFLFPRRLSADALGLTSIRGVIPGVRSTLAAERVTEVFIRRGSKRGRSVTGHVSFYEVNVLARGKRPLRIERTEDFTTAAELATLCADIWKARLELLPPESTEMERWQKERTPKESESTSSP